MQFEGVTARIDAFERADGRGPATTYLRLRLAFILGSEPSLTIAEKASALAMSMSSFAELELLAAEAWLAAGQPQRAVPFARDVVSSRKAGDEVRHRAAQLERRLQEKLEAADRPTPLSAPEPGPLPVTPDKGRAMDSEAARADVLSTMRERQSGNPGVMISTREGASERPNPSAVPHVLSTADLTSTLRERSSDQPFSAPALAQRSDAPAAGPSDHQPTPRRHSGAGALVELLADSAPPTAGPSDLARRHQEPEPVAPLRATDSERSAAIRATEAQVLAQIDEAIARQAGHRGSVTPELDGPAIDAPEIDLSGAASPLDPGVDGFSSGHQEEEITAVVHVPSVRPSRPPPALSEPVPSFPPTPRRDSFAKDALPTGQSRTRTLPPSDLFGVQASPPSDGGEPPVSAPRRISVPPPAAHGASSQPPQSTNTEPGVGPNDGIGLARARRQELDPEGPLRGASMPPFATRSQDSEQGSELREGKRERPSLTIVETMQPPASAEPLAEGSLPETHDEARTVFTKLARELARDQRDLHGVTLKLDLQSLERVQSELLESFPTGLVRTPGEARQLRRYGAFLSEFLARRLGARWVDLSPSELGHWKMEIDPEIEVWPFGRVIRFIRQRHRERDLVAYYLELELRKRNALMFGDAG
jgi:hypothetical protein